MEKKKKSTLFTRLFGNRNKVTDFMTEEQLQSPGRLILKNFLHNRLGMIGLIVFLLIFLLVMIGPKFYTLDLSYQDNTQLNVPPGMNMMSIPDGMKHKVADISPGTTYGVGVDTDGNVYTWGYTKITETIDLKNIPEEVQNAKIVNVAAGYDHIVALDENGAIYVWGNRRLGQDMLPDKLQMLPPTARTSASSRSRPATSSPRLSPKTVNCSSGATAIRPTSRSKKSIRATLKRSP